uniref:Uncharacterized protein n=1 Tax=viral metagenome TaxID=1070528 RepID=A0A6M3IN18_9ZZZZ
MKTALLLIALALPLGAQTILVDGRDVPISLTVPAQEALYQSVLARRAAYVDSASSAIVARLDSIHADVLDSASIVIRADLIDDVYVRVTIPQTDSLLVTARAEWISSGALRVKGDTLRASGKTADHGLTQLLADYKLRAAGGG